MVRPTFSRATSTTDLELTGAGTTGNVVQGNFIGTNASGSAALANHLRGIGISYGAFGNMIGGTVLGARNLISGNMQNGASGRAQKRRLYWLCSASSWRKSRRSKMNAQRSNQ
jgi:hypothetical protein